MTTHSKSSFTTLVRRRERILRELEGVAPVQVAELRTIQLAIDQISAGLDRTRFAGIRSTPEAAEKCLRENGVWMDPRAIAIELQQGGFPMDPENGPRLARESILYNAEVGIFVLRDKLIGLPEWGDSPLDASSK